MLVLSRKAKEQIIVGDKLLVITVLSVGPGRVRLGIDAPDDIAIRRRELVDDHSLVVEDSHALVATS